MSHWDKNINRESNRVAVAETPIEPIFCSRKSITYGKEKKEKEPPQVWDKVDIQRD